jgi:phospholipase/lecithinase/hemolysin
MKLQTSDPQAQILLLGIPPLEYSPYYADSKKQTQIKKRVNEYNVALEDMVTDKIGGATITLSFIDNNFLFADILGNPAGYGLEEVDKAYWNQCQGRCEDSMDTYLWWDSIHLTGAGHKAIADAIVSKNPFGYTVIQEDTSQSNNKYNDDGQTGLLLYADDFMEYAPWFMLFCLVAVVVLVLLRPKQGRRSIVKWSPWKRRKSHAYTAVSSV